MKKIAALTVLLFAVYAFGQSYGALSFGPNAPTLASCPAGAATMTMFCTVGAGSGPYTLNASFNALPYVQIYPPLAQTAGVTSLNGKTGALTTSVTVQ